MAEPSDRELLAIVGGHHPPSPVTVRRALELLYDRHATAVLHLAERLLQDASSAEDVLQDVFVVAAEKAHAVGGSAVGSVRAWLLTIAGNRARDVLRGDRRRDRHERATAHTRGTDADPLQSWIIRDDLAARVAALPPHLALVLELRWRDELTHRQIADALGVSVRTVKYRAAGALEALRATEGDR